MTRTVPRTALALLTGGVIALGAGACGSDDTPEQAASAQEQAPAPQTEGGMETQGQVGGAEQPTQVTGGTTTLRLDENLRTVLDTAGVEIDPVGGARTRDGDLVFPIRQGELDIDTPSGRLAHQGGLRFSAAGRSLEATDLRVDAAREVLTAKIAGRRVPLLGLNLGTPKVPQTGDVIVLPAGAATLSGEAASALNKRLGIDVFGDDLALGEVVVRAQRP